MCQLLFQVKITKQKKVYINKRKNKKHLSIFFLLFSYLIFQKKLIMISKLECVRLPSIKQQKSLHVYSTKKSHKARKLSAKKVNYSNQDYIHYKGTNLESSSILRKEINKQDASTFGYAERNFNILKTNLPGPGSYELDKSQTQKSAQLKRKFQQIRDEASSHSFSIGPGAYEIIKGSSKHYGKLSHFFKSSERRKLFQIINYQSPSSKLKQDPDTLEKEKNLQNKLMLKNLQKQLSKRKINKSKQQIAVIDKQNSLIAFDNSLQKKYELSSIQFPVITKPSWQPYLAIQRDSHQSNQKHNKKKRQKVNKKEEKAKMHAQRLNESVLLLKKKTILCLAPEENLQRWGNINSETVWLHEKKELVT